MFRKFLVVIVMASVCAACATPLRMTPRSTPPAKTKPMAPVTADRDESALAARTLARINTYTNMSDA